MLVAVEDQTYVVDFEHLRWTSGSSEQSISIRDRFWSVVDTLLESEPALTTIPYPYRATLCRINTVTEFRPGEKPSLVTSPFVTGYSLCSHADRNHFSLDTGRKIALTRALVAADFTREQRKAFWDKYLSRKQGGNWQEQKAKRYEA